MQISRRKFVASAGCGLAIPTALRAIDSRVKFKAKTLDGELLTSESLEGKVVLVDFWATWCPYCRKDEQSVDAVLHDFEDKGLVVLAVDVAESKRTVTKYLADSPRDCKIVLMTDTNLAAYYGPKSFPHYVVIDRQGHTAGEQKGAGGERSLRHLLRKAGLTSDGSDDDGELLSSPRHD